MNGSPGCVRNGDPLLEARLLTKEFSTSTAIGQKHVIRAVSNVNLEIHRGAVVAIVGESGSGKTTLVRMLVCLLRPTSGEVILNGKVISGLRGKALREARRQIQMVFQNPLGSLNPRKRVADSLIRPMMLKGLSKGDAAKRIPELLEAVGLDPSSSQRYPHEFSGGQQQRIAIARAISTEPQLIVADEPLSALDASVQAQIVVLIERLRREKDFTLLLIAHDMALVKYLADWIVVMRNGEVVERGTVAQIFDSPQHPYTQQLIEEAGRKSFTKF